MRCFFSFRSFSFSFAFPFSFLLSTYNIYVRLSRYLMLTAKHTFTHTCIHTEENAIYSINARLKGSQLIWLTYYASQSMCRELPIYFLFSILDKRKHELNQIKSEKNTTTDIYFVSNIMDEWVKIGSVVKSLSAWWYHESWAFNMKYMNIIFELPSNRDALKRKLQKKRSKINKKNRIVTEKERKNKTENRNSNCEKKI